jgi:hypothetical protein
MEGESLFNRDLGARPQKIVVRLTSIYKYRHLRYYITAAHPDGWKKNTTAMTECPSA